MLSYCWRFILNDYDEAKLDALRSLLSQEEKVRYAFFVYENCEGVSSIQGYVSFRSQKRASSVRSFFSEQANVEISKGSSENYFDTMSNGKISEEFGCRKRSKRKLESNSKNQLELFKFDVLHGCYDMKRLRLDHSYVCANYPLFVSEFISDHAPKPYWQAEASL